MAEHYNGDERHLVGVPGRTESQWPPKGVPKCIRRLSPAGAKVTIRVKSDGEPEPGRVWVEPRGQHVAILAGDPIPRDVAAAACTLKLFPRFSTRRLVEVIPHFDPPNYGPSKQGKRQEEGRLPNSADDSRLHHDFAAYEAILAAMWRRPDRHLRHAGVNAGAGSLKPWILTIGVKRGGAHGAASGTCSTAAVSSTESSSTARSMKTVR